MKYFPLRCFFIIMVLVIIACSNSATDLPAQNPAQVPSSSPPNHGGIFYQMPEEVITSTNIMRLVQLAQWGKEKINQVVWSSDGKLLALASSNGVYLYKTDSLKELHFIETDVQVNNIAFSPDGNILASGSENIVRLWRVSDGVLMHTLEGHSFNVLSLAFSPDGNILASGSADHTIRLWQASDGIPLLTLEGHTSSIQSLKFSPNGDILASGSLDNTIRLWQVSDGTLFRILEDQPHEENSVHFYVHSLAFSPDGNKLASGLENGEIQLWQISDGALLNRLEGHTLWVESLNFSPDGNLLASGSGDTTIRFWQFSDGIMVRRLSELTMPALSSLAFSPDGRILASSSQDGMITLWGVPNIQQPSPIEGKIAFIGSFVENGDGYWSEGIFVINADGSDLLRLSDDDLISVNSLRWSPDGKELAFIGRTDDQGKNIYLINIVDKNLFQVTQSGALYPNWSPDGGKLLFTSVFKESYQIFEINKDGSEQFCLTCKNSNLQSKNFYASWSPNGLYVIFISTRDSGCLSTNCKGDIYIMNSDGTNQVRLTTNSSNIDFPSWSFDGKHIAYLSEKNDSQNSFDICVMDPDGNNNICLTEGYSLEPGARGEGFTWTPSGQIAAYLTNGTTSGIYLLDMNGNASFLFGFLPYYSGYSLYGTPDSNSIAVVANKFQYNNYLSEADSLYMINTINGDKTFVFSDPKIMHIQEPHWSHYSNGNGLALKQETVPHLLSISQHH